MPLLILLRHGQSAWNLENRFTGTVDIDLSPLGIHEAEQAGKQLKQFPIDILYTSTLLRAVHTANIVLKVLEKNIPVTQNCALNERCYGDLQGLNKADTMIKYGVEQVHLWRRSYETAPPNGESLKNTCDRVIPYFKEKIESDLKNKNVLIIAHGNSLRALIMYLEAISPVAICNFNIATGIPRVYEFDVGMKLQHVYNVENINKFKNKYHGNSQ